MEESLQKALEHYKPSDATVALIQKTPIVLLVGIAGAGKDTIKHRLLQTEKYHHIVSHTTRPPRVNNGVLERDGREYHFISLDESYAMVQAGEYVEAKFVHGTVYGTSVAEISTAAETGKIAVTDLDVQGVAEYKEISPHVIAVFIVPPSFEEWERRLSARYGALGLDEAELHTRMRTATQELREALSQPYYHFVVNEDLERAVEIVDKIAHNHDEFNAVDTTLHHHVEQLLAALETRLA